MRGGLEPRRKRANVESPICRSAQTIRCAVALSIVSEQIAQARAVTLFDDEFGETSMLTAGEIMATNVRTVHPNTSVEDAIELLLSLQVSGLPVTDDNGRLVGVITEFAMLAVTYDRGVCRHTVSQHMTRDVISVDVADPVKRVADLCIVHRVRRVPVMQNGRLVGIIARRDVLQALVNAPAACSA